MIAFETLRSGLPATGCRHCTLATARGAWLLVLSVAWSAASGAPPDKTRYVETWTFDPQSGRWIEQPPPEPGTEDGDLDLARQALARQEFKEAHKLAEAWVRRYGGAAQRYPEALYVKATAALELGDYREAHDTYQSLMTDFPGSVYAERALAADFRIGEQYLDGKKRKAWKGLLRVRDYDEGIKIMDNMIANHADTELAEYALKTKADYYYRRGEFELAEEEYARLARDYPRSRYEPYAALLSAQSALASFPGVKFDDAGLIEAEERFTQFQRRYPHLAEAKQVPVILDQIRTTRAQKEFETARFYERTRKPAAAAFYYRSTVKNWPGTTWAAQAEAKLVAMNLPIPGPETRPVDRPVQISTDAGRPGRHHAEAGVGAFFAMVHLWARLAGWLVGCLLM